MYRLNTGYGDKDFVAVHTPSLRHTYGGIWMGEGSPCQMLILRMAMSPVTTEKTLLIVSLYIHVSNLRI